MRMQVRLLNLDDALQLASLLKPYIDVDQLNPEQDALDFVDGILQEISPQDFLLCVKLLSNKKEEDLEKIDGFETLALFTQGLRDNKIVTLLTFVNSLGK